MYFSTYHWHTTPLGYASFVPPTQADLLNTIDDSLNPPSARLVNVLREFRVRYLVFHTNAYAPTQWQSLRDGLSQVQPLQPVFTDGRDVVYQVLGPAPPHPLAFSYLVSSYAQAQSRSRAYVLVVQPRHYPVVNDDLHPHEVTVQWTDNGTPVASQKFEVRLPQVLRDRAEGVGVDLIAPPRPGTFQLNWYLDSKPLAPIDQNSRVVVDDRAPSDDFQVPIELISYTVEPRQASAGGEVILTLFWRRLQEVERDYDVAVSLQDQSGKEWTKIKRQPVLWTYPPRLWRDGELVADAYAVTVPKQAAPGNYHLTIALTLSNSEQAERFRLPTGSDGSQFATEPLQVVAH
jgi:hypothetical protein